MKEFEKIHNLINVPNIQIQFPRVVISRTLVRFSVIAQLMQRFREPLKPLLDCAQTFGQFFEELAEFAKKLSELPERNRKALQNLGEEGWFLHPDMPFDFLFKIAHLLIEDPNDASKWLCDFFRERLNNIEQELIEAYPHRKRLLCDAFGAHQEGKYSLSVLVFLAQADGIFSEKSSERKSLFIYEQRKDAVQEHASQVVGCFNATYLYPLEVSLPLWMSERQRETSIGNFTGLNRHQVLHGESMDYDTEENSLKVISLLYYLHWVLSRREKTVSS